jgi:hypothetical protein
VAAYTGRGPGPRCYIRCYRATDARLTDEVDRAFSLAFPLRRRRESKPAMKVLQTSALDRHLRATDKHNEDRGLDGQKSRSRIGGGD